MVKRHFLNQTGRGSLRAHSNGHAYPCTGCMRTTVNKATVWDLSRSTLRMRGEISNMSGPGPRPLHPGTVLREHVLPGLGMTVVQASRELGVCRQTLHRILAGTAAVT